MAERRLAAHPQWMQFVDVWSPMSARRCLHLMLEGRAKERPNGVILADDNFVSAATQGIVDAGVRVPDDLSVVALANFPVGIEAAVPVTRIGFDVRAMLDTLATWLEQMRSGQTPPEFRKARALRDDEYAQCTRAEGGPS
jgi:DNA-binding LacI/PurR family transcriptional regulator